MGVFIYNSLGGGIQEGGKCLSIQGLVNSVLKISKFHFKNLNFREGTNIVIAKIGEVLKLQGIKML